MAFEIGETPITQTVEPYAFKPQGFVPGGPLPIELTKAIKAGTYGGSFGLTGPEWEAKYRAVITPALETAAVGPALGTAAVGPATDSYRLGAIEASASSVTGGLILLVVIGGLLAALN